jgi:hypothetical protein
MRLGKLPRGVLAAAALVALLLGATTCSDSNPAVPDTGKWKKEAGLDRALPDTARPDQYRPDTRRPDVFVWPDTKPPQDTWPWQRDGYTGSPFGCQTDVDCFGQKCCPTPWGVMMCAPSCNLK